MHTDTKFRVESKYHSEQIQKALFRVGCVWAGELDKEPQEVQKTEQPYLYVNYDRESNKRVIRFSGHGDRDYFEKDEGVEYVYRLALVEPRDGRPIQQVPPPVLDSEDPNEMHAHAPDPQPFISMDLIRANTIQLDKPPLGVPPRWHADKLHHTARAEELAEAITRYTNAQLKVPVEWVNEWNERVEEIRKLEKTA